MHKAVPHGKVSSAGPSRVPAFTPSGGGTRRMTTGTALILCGMVLCFSSSFIGVKIAYHSFPPFLTVFMRYLIVTPFFLVLHRALRLPWPSRRDFFLLASLGLIEPGLYMMFDSLAMKFTTAGQASLMAATIPLFVVMMGTAVLRVPLRRPVAISALLSVAGIAVIFAHDIRAMEMRHLLGNGSMLCAAAVAALWTLLVKRLGATHPPLTIVTAQACSTLVFSGLLALGESRFLHPAVVTPSAAGAVIYVGIVSSGLGYLTLMTGIQRAGAVMASAFVNLIPVLTILLAALILGEPVTLWLVVGACLVMGAILYLSKHQHLAF